jgi:hypothetical protein
LWCERESRDVPLAGTGVIWLCREDEIDRVNQRVGRVLEPWLDPRWGLEQIVAHLAGFALADSPFTQATPPAPVWSDTPF